MCTFERLDGQTTVQYLCYAYGGRLECTGRLGVRRWVPFVFGRRKEDAIIAITLLVLYRTINNKQQFTAKSQIRE